MVLYRLTIYVVEKVLLLIFVNLSRNIHYSISNLYTQSICTSVLLLENGEVYGFGSNSTGQLGMGVVSVVSTPTKIKNVTTPVDMVACGATHTAVLADNQVVVC